MPLPRRNSFSELLAATLAGIATLNEEQVSRLKQHFDLLERWNSRMNLTSIRSMEEAVVRHYAESIFLATLLRDGGDILDFGSGAGFPGFPIAVYCPQSRVTLLESNQRKAVFLREAARCMPNVIVSAGRGEHLQGEWAWFVSRAVRPDEVVAAAARHSRQVALLVGAVEIEELPPAVAWTSRIALPWGASRWAVVGEILQESCPAPGLGQA